MLNVLKCEIFTKSLRAYVIKIGVLFGKYDVYLDIIIMLKFKFEAIYG